MKLFRKIIVLLLVFTMISGQAMTGVALADNNIPIISENNMGNSGEDDDLNKENVILKDPVIVEKGDTKGIENIPEDDLLNDRVEVKETSAIDDGTGGISISMSSTKTVVKDGEEFTFTIAVDDEDLNTLPNIADGSELVVKLPPYLTSDSFDYLLTDSTYFKSYTYDEDTNTLTLVFKEPGGTWVNFQFNIVTTVNAIGYDGDDAGEIEVGLGGTETGVISSSLPIGIGTGEGGGETHEEPYLKKVIWSNYKESKFGMEEYVVVRDEGSPIGYAVSVGINENYSQRVIMRDNLSNGNLSLCNASGNTSAPIEDCVKVVIDGVTYSGNFTHPVLGNVSVVKEAAGFSVIFERPEGDNATYGNKIKDVVIRYFAILTGDENSISNAVTLSVDDSVSISDASTIVRREDQGLFVNKNAIVDGAAVKIVNLSDDAREVTFRISLSQIGNSTMLRDGKKIIFDLLSDCFIYDSLKVSSNSEYFRLEQDPDNLQLLNIVKNGAGVVPQGNYYIDFTVELDDSKLENGEQATNEVGDTVIVRRPAKITIDKAWAGADAAKGNGAKFSLYDLNGNLISDTGMSDGESFTLYFWADDIAAGENEYVIKETVDPVSEYVAASDIRVIISKDDASFVNIVSVNGIEKNSGAVGVGVSNMLDSGIGSLTFRKYSESVSRDNLLDGGVYELYRVTDGGDVLVGDAFSTVNGEKVFSVPYGTYYVKEISAPEGYILQAETRTENVKLEKVAPHKTVNIINQKYKDGSVTIEKVDDKDEPLAGVTFTLTYADGRTVNKATDENGIASFTGLEAGIYAISETIPVGYTGYNGVIFVTIDEDGIAKTIALPADSTLSASGNAITIHWTNIQLLGSVNIVKHGETADDKLEGAEFVLYSSDMSEVKRGLTDEDGFLEFDNLPFGNYILKEVNAPAGYIIDIDLADGVDVTINSTTPVSLNFSNSEETGSITIEKKDKDTGNALSGAKFGLYISPDSDTPISIKVTGTDGKCSFAGVKSGTYNVRELDAPEGYELSNEVLTFNVGVVEGQTEYVWEYSSEFNNTKKLYDLKLVKVDELGTDKLEGAEFTLTGKGINLTATSAQNGEVIFEDVPYGTYTVTETKAPEGYVAAAPFTVTVNDDNTISRYTPDQTVDFGYVYNDHTKLTVFKVDDKDESKGLPDTKFFIMSGDKYVTASGSNGSYVYDSLSDAGTEFVTAADGKFSLEYIPTGSYVLIETKAPEGYIIATESKSFTVAHANESVVVGNTQVRASMLLTKLDDCGKLLGNVGFTISNAEGYVQATGVPGSYKFTGFGADPYVMYTNGSGVFKISDLLWGDYTIDEVASTTPSGLIPVYGISFSVTDDDHQKTVTLQAIDKRELDDITLYKVDSDGEPLAGAVFKAVCLTTTDYTDRDVRYAVSDDDGIVVFKNLPYGVYEVTEFLAPYGKELSTEVYYLSAGDAEAPEGKTLSAVPVTCINEDIEISTCFKKVSTDGEPLVGMVFDITDLSGKVFYEDVSVNELTGVELTLPVGEYYLIEKQAPVNYVMRSEPVYFNVTVGGRNEVTVENEPFTGEFSVIKLGPDGEKLSGAEFAVYDVVDYYSNGAEAKELYALVTDKNGVASAKNVPFGNYAIIETKAPDRYELNTEKKFFTISPEEDEQNVEISFVNEKSRYVFEIYKVDVNDESKFISDCEFLVYGSGLYTTVFTGAEGKATVEVPAPGIYNVVEIRAPEGYTIDPNVYQIEVQEHTPENAPIESRFVSKDFPTELHVVKVNENDKIIDGAVFELYSVNDGIESLVRLSAVDGGYVYDESGAVTSVTVGSAVIKKLPVSKYVLHEATAPANYISLSDIAFEITDTEYDKPVVVTAQNFPYERGVAVCKENEAGVRLKDAEFTLYDADGEVIKTAVTGASGYASFGELRCGSYSFKETAAPVGYKPVDDVFSFTIDENGSLNGDGFVSYGSEDTLFYVLTVADEPITYSFRIGKISAFSGNGLDGAQFRIIGSGLDRTFSTEDGYAQVTELPVGEYMLTEIKAPVGYVASAESHFVKVTPDGVYIDSKLLEGDTPEYVVSNKPESFEFAIEKLDENSGKPLEGAAFTIVGSDGSRNYLVTDANGSTDSVTLMPGEYAVTESVAPKGYNVPLAGWNFTVEEGTMRITKTGGQADYSFENGKLTITVTNKRTTGSILIHKTDADNDMPLAEAQFMVLDASEACVWFTMKNGVYHVDSADNSNAGNVLSTNAMGQALLDGLKFGNYTITEVTAPYGYKLDTEGVFVKLTEQDETLEVSFKNEQLKRRVTVIKESAEDHSALLGAVFALYTVKDGSPDMFVAESTTLYDGKAMFEVTYGDYLIVETRAPLGYELSTQEPVFFSYNDDTPEDETFVFSFANEKTHYAIEAYKFDETTGEPLAGAVFAFTDSRGYTKVIETNERGIALLDDVAYDDFTIREIIAPNGYYLNEEEFFVRREELKHDEVVRFSVPDEFILGSVDLKKVDYEDETKILDARFTVTDSDGNELLWEAVDGGYVLSDEGESIINAGNVTLSEIPAGSYTLTEVKAPDGYLKLTESYEFNITAENAIPGVEITVKNLERKVAVGILKVDGADSAKRLEGAEFTLFSVVDGNKGEPLAVVETDENGTAVFTDLTMGEYIVNETAAPYGYKLWQKSINVTVDGDGNVTVGSLKLPDIDSVFMIAVANECILKDITVKKVDSDNRESLSGAVFKITGEDRTWNFTTDSKGEAKLSLPYGEYIIEEIIAPEGYKMSDAKYLLNISETGIKVNGNRVESSTIEIENAPIVFPISIHKQDSVTANYLSNVEFTITGKNGFKVELKTNASGDTDTVFLRYGEYTITETKASDDYKLPLNGWKLTVKKDGTMVVDGDSAVLAVNARSYVVTIDNVYQGTLSPFVKTGESRNDNLLLLGTTLSLSSFTGLTVIVADEKKRRRKDEV